MANENEPRQLAYSTEFTQEKLKYHLHYNPNTGLFTWLVPTISKVMAGAIAGHIDDSKGYVIISLFGQHYYGHVLAWFYIHGEWKRIDHRNRQGIDNRLDNLRPATQTQNVRNQSVRIDNLLGVKGVTQIGNKFIARIFVDGKRIYLGSYETLEEAASARQAAAITYFGEFSNG